MAHRVAKATSRSGKKTIHIGMHHPRVEKNNPATMRRSLTCVTG